MSGSGNPRGGAGKATGTVGLALIGPGKVGRTLATALSRGGWPIRCIAGRRAGPARSLARALGPSVTATSELRRASHEARLILLALPETALPEVADLIAAQPGFRGRGRTFLHTSGGAPDDILEVLRDAGAATGRFHPLYPFTGRPDDADKLQGIYYGIGGDCRAIVLSARLARILKGRLVKLPAGAAASYHLSAVVTANLTIALAAAAAELGEEWGKERSAALEALLPLLQATVNQLAKKGLPAALTGPLVRGETRTVAAQLELLKKARRPELAEVYRLLSRSGLELAHEAGHLDQRKPAD